MKCAPERFIIHNGFYALKRVLFNVNALFIASRTPPFAMLMTKCFTYDPQNLNIHNDYRHGARRMQCTRKGHTPNARHILLHIVSGYSPCHPPLSVSSC